MDLTTPVPQPWHIPRPSLSGSSASASSGDSRSRGGSASSQGSSSNHSTHSVSSGSLLLSAAHLARVNSRHSAEPPPDYRQQNLERNKLSDTIVAIPEESRDPADGFWRDVKRGPPPPAEGDARSVASSTHFTVVNGFTRRGGKQGGSCCCSQSHQITVLVVTMTILFSACILAAVCFVEMKMRKENGVYKYS